MSRNPRTEPLQFVPFTKALPVRHRADPTVTPTSGLATVAFWLSILGFATLGIGSGAAVILAASAWRSTRDGDRAGHFLTVSALFLGVLGMAVTCAAVWVFRDYHVPAIPTGPFRAARNAG